MSSPTSKPPTEEKPKVEQKSSLQLLSELFETFDAEPPVIVKKERSDGDDHSSKKKHKKSKKKHKHKDKKHKKKSKKRKRNHSSSSGHSSDDSSVAIDLTDILLSGTAIKTEAKIKADPDNPTMSTEDKNDVKPSLTDLEKCSSTFSAALETLQESQKLKNENDRSDSAVKSKSKSNKNHKCDGLKREERDKNTSNSDTSSSRKRKISPIVFDMVEAKSRKSHEKHKAKDREHGEHRHRREREPPSADREDKSQGNKKSRSKSRSRSRSKERSTRERAHHRHSHKHENSHRDDRPTTTSTEVLDNKFYRGSSRDRDRERDRDKKRGGERDSRSDDIYRTEDRGVTERWQQRSDRSRQNTSSLVAGIDKKKLLEIARRNAMQMMKKGELPDTVQINSHTPQHTFLAAIRSGGKTIGELTDFCKTLSAHEELGDLSDLSDDVASDSERPEQTDKLAFHHPFQIKERPSTIVMNIKNATSLPTKSNQERTSELRLQFPVSSGQHHRKTESEWVPVEPTPPYKAPPKPKSTVTLQQQMLAIMPAPATPAIAIPAPAMISHQPPLPLMPPPTTDTNGVPTLPQLQIIPPLPPQPPVDNIFASTMEGNSVDVAQMVTQRLMAMRRLQENPYDVEAMTNIYSAEKKMTSWAESKQQIGQFTGSTGANILSQAELASGYQPWARKDQLQTAAPVSGGMGMHLLQKMGWKPGEGLGKEKSGTLEPLLLEVKLDKKGIVAREEQKQKGVTTIPKGSKPLKTKLHTVHDKHPVSLLGEYSTKKKLLPPVYTCCMEAGPDHKKNFVFSVELNGNCYKPNIVCGNKKEAKALAATLCLQEIGLIPRSPFLQPNT